MHRLRAGLALFILLWVAWTAAISACAQAGGLEVTPAPTATQSQPSPATPSPTASDKKSDSTNTSSSVSNIAVAALITGLFTLTGAIITAVVSVWKIFFDVKRFNEMMRTTLTDEVSNSTWNVIFERLSANKDYRQKITDAIASDKESRQKITEAISSDEKGRQRLTEEIFADEKGRLKVTESLIFETLFSRAAADNEGRKKLIEAVITGLVFTPEYRPKLHDLIKDNSATVELAELQKPRPESHKPQLEPFPEEIELVRRVQQQTFRKRKGRAPYRPSKK